jgi:hypothetical protein
MEQVWKNKKIILKGWKFPSSLDRMSLDLKVQNIGNPPSSSVGADLDY